MFQRRNETASRLKRDIKDLQRQNLILQRQCDQTPKMEANVRTLQKDLILEETRVRALSEELENPDNPHRWRHLIRDDPPAEKTSPFDNSVLALDKIKEHQQRLIEKSEELVNRKQMIKNLKEAIKKAQEDLSKLPNPVQLQNVKNLQLKVREKDRLLKSYAAELTSHNMKIADFDDQEKMMSSGIKLARDDLYLQKKTVQRLTHRRSRSQRPSNFPSRNTV